MEKEYSFSGQWPDEKILEVAHQNPYLLYPSGFIFIILLSLSVAVFSFWPFLYYVAIAILIFASLYFFRSFYGFRESMLIITDKRVIYINQKGFFNRKISEVEHVKIIDAASVTKGFTQVMLKYGDLVLRTVGAGDGGDIVIKDISNPYYFQQKITKLAKAK